MKSILLIGLGRFGKHLATQLNILGHQVMAVDHSEERVNEILPLVTNAQIGDSTNPDFLQSLGISDYDVCIVAISNDFQSSLETTSLLKELGAKFVVSRAERMFRQSFYFVMVPMKLSIQRNKLQNGQQYDIAPITFLTILNLMKPMQYLKYLYRNHG